jgi:hypothetical protein
VSTYDLFLAIRMLVFKMNNILATAFVYMLPEFDQPHIELFEGVDVTDFWKRWDIG